jgi:hypothetical protein
MIIDFAIAGLGHDFNVTQCVSLSAAADMTKWQVFCIVELRIYLPVGCARQMTSSPDGRFLSLVRHHQNWRRERRLGMSKDWRGRIAR